jgi:hypothetical protein
MNINWGGKEEKKGRGGANLMKNKLNQWLQCGWK